MCVVIVVFIVCVTGLGVAAYGRRRAFVALTAGLSVFAIGLNVVQVLPQIWQTWRTRRVGALSIPAMCMQTPGGIVFAVILSRTATGNWTTWVPYLVSALLQGVLLLLCLRYRRNRDEPLQIPPSPIDDSCGGGPGSSPSASSSHSSSPPNHVYLKVS
jgi:hypothetical protein